MATGDDPSTARGVAPLPHTTLGCQHAGASSLDTRRPRCCNKVLHVHGGIPYFWDNGRGLWIRCCGLVPQILLKTLTDYFLVAEGVFRCLPATQRRSDEDLLAATEEAFQSSNTSWERVRQQWRDAAVLSDSRVGKGRSKGKRSLSFQERNRREDEAAVFEANDSLAPFGMAENRDDAEKAPWQLHTARMVSTVCSRIEHGLAGKVLLVYYAGWCATPQPDVPRNGIPGRRLLV